MTKASLGRMPVALGMTLISTCTLELVHIFAVSLLAPILKLLAPGSKHFKSSLSKANLALLVMLQLFHASEPFKSHIIDDLFLHKYVTASNKL